MDIDLRIILLVIGAVFIIGLIVADNIKRKKKENLPYKRFSEGKDFELPSMSTVDDGPNHDTLDELRVDETASAEPMAFRSELKDKLEDEGSSKLEMELGKISSEASDDSISQASEQPDSKLSLENEALASDAVVDEVQDEKIEESPNSSAPQMVLSLLVLAPKGEQFRGSQIKMALSEAGFTFGKMDIFHLSEGDESLVSVANVVEPGSFLPDELADFKTPGLVVFSQLPALLSGGEVYAKWYKAAKKINVVLGGRLTDLHQNPLDSDAFDALRLQAEEISAALPGESGE